jgi:hypothetical protein
MDLRIKWIASADHCFFLRDAKIFYQPCFISEVCSDTLGVFSHFVPTINNDLGEQTVQIFGRSLWACSILVQISRLSIQIIFGTQLYACILLRLEFSWKNCHEVSIIQSVLALLIIFTSRAYNSTYLVNHSIFVAITEPLMGNPLDSHSSYTWLSSCGGLLESHLYTQDIPNTGTKILLIVMSVLWVTSQIYLYVTFSSQFIL